jgi:hypothetical protein
MPTLVTGSQDRFARYPFGLCSPRRAGQAAESVVALAEEPAALFCYVRRVECGKKDTARTLS